jgi:hypothetical protein
MVARRAFHCGGAVIVGAADDEHVVTATFVALPREVAGGVAIDTTRVSENGGDLTERFDGTDAIGL